MTTSEHVTVTRSVVLAVDALLCLCLVVDSPEGLVLLGEKGRVLAHTRQRRLESSLVASHTIELIDAGGRTQRKRRGSTQPRVIVVHGRLAIGHERRECVLQTFGGKQHRS